MSAERCNRCLRPGLALTRVPALLGEGWFEHVCDGCRTVPLFGELPRYTAAEDKAKDRETLPLFGGGQ